MGDIGSAIGGTLGFIGARQANEASTEQSNANRVFNAQQAQLSRNWATQMMGSQEQMRVQDLKKAGLNPAMALGAGASPMGGATAAYSGIPNMQNPGLAGAQGAAAGSAAGVNAASVANVNADTRQKDAVTDTKIPAEVKNLAAQYDLTSGQASILNDTKKWVEDQKFFESETARYQSSSAEMQSRIDRMDEQTKAAFLTEARRTLDAELRAAGNSASNVAAVQGGTWGRAVSYAEQVLGIGGKAINIGGRLVP